MPGLHVIRKKQTKEMVLMCGTIETEEERVANERGTLIWPDLTPSEDEEYVFLPQMSRGTVMEVATIKAKGKEPDKAKKEKIYDAGSIRIHDTHIDADPPTGQSPRPTMAARIKEMREKKGASFGAPLTLEELEAVADDPSLIHSRGW